jgi:hypothetical protein
LPETTILKDSPNFSSSKSSSFSPDGVDTIGQSFNRAGSEQVLPSVTTSAKPDQIETAAVSQGSTGSSSEGRTSRIEEAGRPTRVQLASNTDGNSGSGQTSNLMDTGSSSNSIGIEGSGNTGESEGITADNDNNTVDSDSSTSDSDSGTSDIGSIARDSDGITADNDNNTMDSDSRTSDTDSGTSDIGSRAVTAEIDESTAGRNSKTGKASEEYRRKDNILDVVSSSKNAQKTSDNAFPQSEVSVPFLGILPIPKVSMIISGQ